MNNQTIALDDDEDDTEEVMNITDLPAKFNIENMRINLKPGECVRLHKAYTQAQKTSDNRDLRASAIHLLTGGRVVPKSHPSFPKTPKQVAASKS